MSDTQHMGLVLIRVANANDWELVPSRVQSISIGNTQCSAAFLDDVMKISSVGN